MDTNLHFSTRIRTAPTTDNINVLSVLFSAGKEVQRGQATPLSPRALGCDLEEVPADQRASILKAYLQCAPGARPHVPVNKDAPLAEFEKVATAFPVFRVVSNAHHWAIARKG
ncbi:MAG TPA: hypothetical protein VFA10_30605 [Ktedonobacteraceae bacterium]|nr:hypothetical protein [Ktedonobacteraceae bacterium]